MDINTIISYPLISERKALKEKTSYFPYFLSSLGIMNYKGKDLILVGYCYGKLEIYSTDLALFVE